MSDTGANGSKLGETNAAAEGKTATNGAKPAETKAPAEVKTATNGAKPAETKAPAEVKTATNGAKPAETEAPPKEPENDKHPLQHGQINTALLGNAARVVDTIVTREALCRAIQFSAKFLSGTALSGPAHEVDASIASARKAFWLLKTLNELNELKQASKKETAPRKLLSQSKCTIMAGYYLLDNLLWAARMGIYKNKEHANLLELTSLYLYIGGSAVGCATEGVEILHDKHNKGERMLNITKHGLDIVVAAGLLPLEKKLVPPRVTGACGVASALITLFQEYTISNIPPKSLSSNSGTDHHS